jgi:hypothetical protein
MDTSVICGNIQHLPTTVVYVQVLLTWTSQKIRALKQFLENKQTKTFTYYPGSKISNLPNASALPDSRTSSKA